MCNWPISKQKKIGDYQLVIYHPSEMFYFLVLNNNEIIEARNWFDWKSALHDFKVTKERLYGKTDRP